METISPIYRFLFDLIIGLKAGVSIHQRLAELLEIPNNEFLREMKVWWRLYLNKGESELEMSTNNRKLLVEVLSHGLEGASILGSLEDLYKDVEQQREQQLQSYLERLPFKLLLPLLFCFFPAFLILLFGPLLLHIQMEVFG